MNNLVKSVTNIRTQPASGRAPVVSACAVLMLTVAAWAQVPPPGPPPPAAVSILHKLCVGSGLTCTASGWACNYATFGPPPVAFGAPCWYCTGTGALPVTRYCAHYPNAKCLMTGLDQCAPKVSGTCLPSPTAPAVAICLNTVIVDADDCTVQRCVIPTSPAPPFVPPIAAPPVPTDASSIVQDATAP